MAIEDLPRLTNEDVEKDLYEIRIWGPEYQRAKTVLDQYEKYIASVSEIPEERSIIYKLRFEDDDSFLDVILGISMKIIMMQESCDFSYLASSS